MTNQRKQKILMSKLDIHLRKTARQMIQFDTLDKTLHYLIDSVHSKLACDYMAIITVERMQLQMKAKMGNAARFEACFPMVAGACTPRIFQESFTSFDVIDGKEEWRLLSCLDEERFQTWFTIPIRTEAEISLGLCVIGFRHFVPLLLEADTLFEEYGKDIATAFALAQQKEQEIKRIQGLEWLKENVYLDGSSLEQIIESIVERAGKGTGAKAAAVYLYDERADCLVLHVPSYGGFSLPEQIDLKLYDLTTIFPYLELIGGQEITMPLTINLKTIGVLHVLSGEGSLFSSDDLELLQFIASHVSSLIENNRLYSSEKDQKNRLEKFMQHQQEMVKHTLEDDGFGKITAFLSQMMSCSVLLFDRFFHIASSAILQKDDACLGFLMHSVDEQKKRFKSSRQLEHWIAREEQFEAGIWKVVGAGEVLGYLGLIMPRSKLDIVLKMTLNHALNVYAVQFIKQKAVLDIREQVKDGFIHRLLTHHIQDQSEIRENANLLNWNIDEPHTIGIFMIEFEKDEQKSDLFEANARRNWIRERIRDYVSRTEPGIVLTRKDEYVIAIVPQERAKGDFWKSFYERVRKLILGEFHRAAIYAGISQEANHIEDYVLCYKQAQKTLTILCAHFPSKGYLSFQQLGCYSVLYHLDDPLAVPLFIKTYIEPLLRVGNGKNRDLFNTLRVYLQTNGNIKDAAEILYIHRSSLKYRLEKIRGLLTSDIDDAEQRFNLMLAYKLHDLFSADLQLD
ncbi:helix-turn-helix domain-containing protein [Paenibacillus sp. GCM10027628]|uniref:helix-turn-helix domain-containing protein n=1 Tax=Paenibacillus sp. GCM10027628 TaxID=3273413 RepID=UPI0036263637